MARKSETFILKEFIVGFIVLLFFLFIFLFITRKFTGSTVYKNLFPKEFKTALTTQSDNCGELGFGFAKSSSNTNFLRTVTRPGYANNKYPFILSIVPAGENSFIIETVSTIPEIPQEKITASCLPERIDTTLGTLLVSSILNVFPDKLSEFAQYQIIEPKLSIITRQARIDHSSWENSFSLKGIMDENCFLTEASGISTIKKEDNPQDSVTLGIITVTTNWTATTSANMSGKKTPSECYTDQSYDQSVKVEVEETFGISEADGIIQYDISSRGIVGQASILPNGYTPASYSNAPVQEPTGQPTVQPSISPSQ